MLDLTSIGAYVFCYSHYGNVTSAGVHKHGAHQCCFDTSASYSGPDFVHLIVKYCDDEMHLLLDVHANIIHLLLFSSADFIHLLVHSGSFCCFLSKCAGTSEFGFKIK